MYEIRDGTTQESPFESSRSEDKQEGSKVAARSGRAIADDEVASSIESRKVSRASASRRADR